VTRGFPYALLLVFLVGIVLSPLRAMAAAIPMVTAYDAAVWRTATVRVEAGPSVQPDRGSAPTTAYGDDTFGYDSPSSRRVANGSGAFCAYDDALEHADMRTGAAHAHDRSLGHADRREAAEGVICADPLATTAAEGAGAVISEGKFGYLFGEASGNAHNVERALENASQLSRVGVYNNAEGQALLQGHFDAVVGDSSNIISSTSNQYGNFVTRESLFAGPGGFIKFQSTWQVMEGGAQRFITAIPFGGP
jgi:filamentous hemagglutinin